jgi:hypothetical protein
VHDREEVNANAVQATRGARIDVFFFSPHRDEGGDDAVSHDACWESHLLQRFATNVTLDPVVCSAHSASYEAVLK